MFDSISDSFMSISFLTNIQIIVYVYRDIHVPQKFDYKWNRVYIALYIQSMQGVVEVVIVW